MTEYVLGGGCFWCIDAVYRRLKGVVKTDCGYAGGHDASPNYQRVSSGTTGHAEVVRVTFDESIISPDTILDIFFLIHNPTTINQQGADVGTQYRSIMLAADENQKQLFEAASERAANLWDDPIVTSILPLEMFYPAEDEHQDYFNKNPESGYCQVVIAPKISNARAAYAQWFKVA